MTLDINELNFEQKVIDQNIFGPPIYSFHNNKTAGCLVLISLGWLVVLGLTAL